MVTGAGNLPVGNRDPAPSAGVLPRASVLVELEHGPDGYAVGANTTPGAVAAIEREAPGAVVVRLARPWPAFARLVPVQPFPTKGEPWVVIEVRPLDACRLRVVRRAGFAFQGSAPMDGGPIRFTVHAAAPRGDA